MGYCRFFACAKKLYPKLLNFFQMISQCLVQSLYFKTAQYNFPAKQLAFPCLAIAFGDGGTRLFICCRTVKSRIKILQNLPAKQLNGFL